MGVYLEKYFAQARRIAQHREEGAERIIRKMYKHMYKDLQTFVSETYVQYAEDDKLTFAMLQKVGYDARFLEEIEQHINLTTPKTAQELRALVEETYRIAYEGMVNGVARAGVDGLDAAFAEHMAITPEQIKRAVENPVSGLTLKDTLEKNRKDIIYSIKQAVGVGLMNGDRYSTMARRIAEVVDGDYKKAVRIARTEAHRVREAGNYDAAAGVDQALQNSSTGLRMVKTWKSMQDERVRPQRRRKGRKGWSTKMGKGPNHMILDGQTVLADEAFDLKDGRTSPAPGLCGVAGHDINCRCYASYEMLDDAEYFAKTGKHFPGLENSGKSGIIKDAEELDLDKREADALEEKLSLEKKLDKYNADIRANEKKQDEIFDFSELVRLSEKADLLAAGRAQTIRQLDRIKDQLDGIRRDKAWYKYEKPFSKLKTVEEIEQAITRAGWFDGKVSLALCPVDTARSIAASFNRVFDVYPALKGRVKGLRTAPLGVNIWAGFDPTSRGILISGATYSASKDELRKRYSELVDKGYFPKATDYRSIFVHEMGHTIDFLVGEKKGVERISYAMQYDYLCDVAGFKSPYSPKAQDYVAEHVSRYAQTNQKELFAECFSEYLTSPRPREMAKWYGKRAEQEIREWLET